MEEEIKKEILNEVSEIEKKLNGIKKHLGVLKKLDPVEEKVTYQYNKKEPGFAGVLISLVIILLIVDCVALIFYYKPDFSGFFKSHDIPYENKVTGNFASNISTTIKCSDGTLNKECSSKKPYFCYDGQLIKSANSCGCPSGYIQNFQDCKKLS